MCFQDFPLKKCPLLTHFAFFSYGKERVQLSIEHKMESICHEGQTNKIEGALFLVLMELSCKPNDSFGASFYLRTKLM